MLIINKAKIKMHKELLIPSPEELEKERLELEEFEQEVLEWERQEEEELEMERQRELELAENLEWEQEAEFAKEEALAEEAKREHLSPDFMTGLGRWAVEKNIEIPINVADDESVDEYWEQRIHPELEEVRDQLNGLNEHQREHVNELISGRRASAWLDEMLNLSEKTGVKPYIETLLAQDEKGNYIVGDGVLMNFLELHNTVLAEEHEKLNALDGELKASYEADFTTAVNEDLVQESALKRLQLLLPHSKLVADDGFDTSAWGVEGKASSTIFNGLKEDEIKVAPKYIKDKKKLKRLLGHEFTHIGHGEDEVEDEESVETPAGGMERIIDGSGGTVLNEAVVEQFAETLEKGEPDEADPDSDIRKGAMYPEPRKLLHVLANKGVKKIDIRDFFKAHFESSREAAVAGDDSYQTRLINELDEAFPFTDIREEIANLEIRDSKGIKEYAERLQGRATEYQASLVKS